jgi:DUF3102 family protein
MSPAALALVPRSDTVSDLADTVCFQRKRRDAEAAKDNRPQDATLDYVIGRIDAKEASAFIKRYEWLGTVGRPIARYCARHAEVAAVALFGRPAVQSAAICREIKDISNQSDDDRAYLRTVVCLERGACAHFAHPHTASWFIPRVLKLAHAEHGWQIFYAYSDTDAGEIGTIYQACNWLYIGQGVGRGLTPANTPRPREYFRRQDWKEGKFVSDRAFYRRSLEMDVHVGIKDGIIHMTGLDAQEPWRNEYAENRQWEMKKTAAKHKYVQFVGDKRERRDLIRALRYQRLPYPKRPVDTGGASPSLALVPKSDTVSDLAGVADRIRALEANTIADRIEMGRLLSEARKTIGHGGWLPWLKAEFKWTERTARRYVRDYKATLTPPEPEQQNKTQNAAERARIRGEKRINDVVVKDLTTEAGLQSFLDAIEQTMQPEQLFNIIGRMQAVYDGRRVRRFAEEARR